MILPSLFTIDSRGLGDHNRMQAECTESLNLHLVYHHYALQRIK
jgi:hypothetical protein